MDHPAERTCSAGPSLGSNMRCQRLALRDLVTGSVSVLATLEGHLEPRKALVAYLAASGHLRPCDRRSATCEALLVSDPDGSNDLDCRGTEAGAVSFGFLVQVDRRVEAVHPAEETYLSFLRGRWEHVRWATGISVHVGLRNSERKWGWEGASFFARALADHGFSVAPLPELPGMMRPLIVTLDSVGQFRDDCNRASLSSIDVIAGARSIAFRLYREVGQTRPARTWA